MTDYTSNLVDAIISGKATDIEAAFKGAITDKISIAMEDKRNSMAQSMFTKESADAYELHDPKHPHFVKNHTKWKKSNPNGTTAEFISHMKTKRFNVDEELTLEDYSIEEIEDFMMSEDFEQLDELSKKTLGNYIKKASDDSMSKSGEAGYKLAANYPDEGDKDYAVAYKRNKGIAKAVDKLTKEDFNQVDELSTNLVGKYLDSTGYKLSTIRHGDGTVTEPTPQTPQRKAGRNLAAAKLGWKVDGEKAKIRAVPSWKIVFDKAQAKKNLTKESIELDEAGGWRGHSQAKKADARKAFDNLSDEELNKQILGRNRSLTPREGAKALEVHHLTGQNEYWNRIKKFHESVELDDYSIEEIEDFMVSEDFELEEAVTASQLIANHNSSDHGGAQHFSNVDGIHHSWNYVKKNKEGTKYEVTPDKGEAEGIAHKGKFLKMPK